MGHTECVTDVDKRSEMIFLKSLLTTFEPSIIFYAAGALTEIVLPL